MTILRNIGIALLVVVIAFAWSLVLKVGVRAEKVPQTPAEEWLSWSPEAKMRYVHGYLKGFERGKRVACYWHEAREASSTGPYLPAGTCINNLPQFTEPYQHVYVEAITNYFRKYPNDRQAGWSSILDELASPPNLTIDKIHAKLGTSPK
jgi:hypothetical protein